MIHTIIECKDDFLRRDQRPPSRLELEGTHCKWAWFELAKTFNDESFDPDPWPSKDGARGNWDNLSPKYDGYPATPGSLNSN